MNKTKFTDSELEEAMIRIEDAIISYSKVEIKKSFVYVEIDGHPFRVRVYECGSEKNETIVLTLAYEFPQLHFMHLWTRLAERYRVVVFEHGSSGLNTKLDDSYGLDSSDAAEQWLIEWTVKVFSKLELPDKFHLMGQCWSANIVMYYASQHPERVLSYFNVSPLGSTSLERVSEPNYYSFPAYMLPKGVTPRQLMQKRISM